MIRVLLWDVDNTLLDFPAAERRALQETFAQFRLGPCPEDRVERYAALNASYWRRLERGEITKAQLLPGRFQEFFQREGIACTDYDQVNAAYQCHLGDTVVFLDQSYDLVRDLRGRVKQYAVTNGTRTAQERKLARSGLGDLFDGVFISEVVGAEKPSLDFFQAAEPLFRELEGLDAYGVIFLDTAQGKMTPLVKVPATDTLVWEGSCGSGSLAAALSQSAGLEEGEFARDYLQPAGVVRATVVRRNGSVTAAYIGGPVTLGQPMEVEL